MLVLSKCKAYFDNNNSFSFLKKFEIRFLIHNNRFEHCNIFYNRGVNQRVGNILRNKIWENFKNLLDKKILNSDLKLN